MDGFTERTLRSSATKPIHGMAIALYASTSSECFRWTRTIGISTERLEAMVTKSTTSSDRDLERRVLGYLCEKHVPSFRRLTVEACDGVVTLRGRVSSFYEKQLAHHCCRRVAGVTRLVDAMEVN
jgi:osmotically-inducible protein OsmY